jgi:hypothetical protein
MRFGEQQRFEAKVLVDDKGVREYVDADDNTWVRTSARRALSLLLSRRGSWPKACTMGQSAIACARFPLSPPLVDSSLRWKQP